MKLITTLIIGILIGLFIAGMKSEAAIDVEEAIRLAYREGKTDAQYEKDDIGLKRLTVKDIGGLL